MLEATELVGRLTDNLKAADTSTPDPKITSLERRQEGELLAITKDVLTRYGISIETADLTTNGQMLSQWGHPSVWLSNRHSTDQRTAQLLHLLGHIALEHTAGDKLAIILETRNREPQEALEQVAEDAADFWAHQFVKKALTSLSPSSTLAGDLNRARTFIADPAPYMTHMLADDTRNPIYHQAYLNRGADLRRWVFTESEREPLRLQVE